MKTAFIKFLLPCLLLIVTSSYLKAQPELSIEKIMQDPVWIGVSPENPTWSGDGKTLYFRWNPEKEPESSWYALKTGDPVPYRISEEEEKNLPTRWVSYNKDRTKKVFVREGDIFLEDKTSGKLLRITRTTGSESSPSFSQEEDKVLFYLSQNIYSWDISKGTLEQLTDMKQGNPPQEKDAYPGENEKWLYEDQMKLFEVLRKKKEARERRLADRTEKSGPPYTIYTGQGRASSLQMSPCGRFFTWVVYHTPRDAKNTMVPNFVTESGYTEEINARPKVGTNYYNGSELWAYDTQKDTSYRFSTTDIPGLNDLPDYQADYPDRKDKKSSERPLLFSGLNWSPDGKQAVVNIISLDNKDRWIMLANPENGSLSLLDRQRDDAWIGGPGIGQWGATLGWMPDSRQVYFQSEESGFSHLYTVDVKNGKKKALTRGDFEVYEPFISGDKKSWYFHSNKVHHGERHFYRMPVDGGKAERLTFMEGRNDAFLAPDESMIALIHSKSNRPEELYLLENRKEAEPVQVTRSLSEEFHAYPWRKPEFVTFKASDGAKVPARLYLPEKPAESRPAVIFVHGAGYLQNAHKWWSTYFREYMFHNLLVDRGYTVLDIDYRGSAGYGRDWRTAIYRHMGGKDLSDQVDGARWLVETHGVNPEKIGIYGGSYGGFITLMALFTEPEVFAAGAALRAVTDWAHYNHGYTANILNVPVTDSLAYVRSSPIYYAEGLQGALLMCHGMVDDNVHFQDIVRLTQRLIELGKENWELAVYPVESHAFTEPSSWTDEYKRIYQLFEENLK